jgi:hypothetical protein
LPSNLPIVEKPSWLAAYRFCRVHPDKSGAVMMV